MQLLADLGRWACEGSSVLGVYHQDVWTAEQDYTLPTVALPFVSVGVGGLGMMIALIELVGGVAGGIFLAIPALVDYRSCKEWWFKSVNMGIVGAAMLSAYVGGLVFAHTLGWFVCYCCSRHSQRSYRGR